MFHVDATFLLFYSKKLLICGDIFKTTLSLFENDLITKPTSTDSHRK